MEKLKLHTPDLTTENIEKLTALFPDCITEARDERGNLTRAVDFDQLRQELSASIVEGPRERYHLDWPGKGGAILAANAPIARTLRPCHQESVNFGATKNLFIEGDNLDALKLLREIYLDKVKMIYIDPPYNTGSDLIYQDRFCEDTDTYLRLSNQVADNGSRLVVNPETNGRFHSDWLSMMLGRLKLARNLLREDGVLFISIDDREQAALKLVCDEVFGGKNFLGCACRVSKKANNQGDFWAPNFDYVLTYARDRDLCPVFFGGVNYDAYKESDSEGPRAGEKYQLIRLYMTSLDPLRGCNNQRYFIEAPDGTLLIPPGEVFPEERKDAALVTPKTAKDKVWRWARETYLREKDKIVVRPVRSSNLVDAEGKAVNWNVFTKTYLNDVIANTTAKPNSLIEDHINQNSSKELGELEVPFTFAKPSSLIQYLCEIARLDDDDIVLDFFAGSGTTAHALFSLNAAANTRRRFILVQLPEVLEQENKNHLAGIAFCKGLGIKENIAEISKERIRRAGRAVQAKYSLIAPDLDTGFRVLKIDTSNMKDVYYTPDESKQHDLLAQVDNIKADRTPEDLLFQVLVDWGVDLALPIAKETLATKTVFFVDGNALPACFDQDITEDLVKEIAKRKPLRAVFRDSSYGSDSVKINVEQIFKLLSPSTEIKSL